MNVTTDTDTYEVIDEGSKETFAMNENKCYSNVCDITSSESRDKTATSKKQPHFIALGVLFAVMMVLLAASCVCAVAALAEISRLRAEMQSETSNLQSEVDKIDTITQQLLTHILEDDSINISELANRVIHIVNLSTNACPYFTTSCASLPPSCPSGYYLLATSTSAVRVYCDMTRTCGNVTGGWMRVGYLNMTDNSGYCPVGLRQQSYGDIRTCLANNNINCSSVTYQTANFEYSRVCGRVKAYQVGGTNAFRQFYLSPNSITINSAYVDGVSLTHSNPRQHIWTFVAALDNNYDQNSDTRNYCPCQTPRSLPSFIGSNYFCDSGSEDFISTQQPQFYGTDPLWDGAGCEPPNTCCSFNSPPWFYKQLPQPTTDDIEMRVCRDEASSSEDIAIVEVEIYVQ